MKTNSRAILVIRKENNEHVIFVLLTFYLEKLYRAIYCQSPGKIFPIGYNMNNLCTSIHLIRM